MRWGRKGVEGRKSRMAGVSLENALEMPSGSMNVIDEDANES